MTDRRAHWIRQNHQERMPARMVAFDTESKSTYDDDLETQEWRVGCAIRWRTDLKTGDCREASVFDDPESFWGWVAEYTRQGCRTVVWAHNLGHDVRISRMFDILPKLGFRLEWCNLDRNISSATWRSEHGSIVLADTWTWIPLPLAAIAPQVGMIKYEMPRKHAQDSEWARYCMHDAEILHNVVRVLMAYVTSEGLGNWQPTGAGMAYASWRHRFLGHKVLVHDDRDALEAERTAMHTGRAEAWRHGKVHGENWTEVDLRNAYLTIASECDLPRKLHMQTGALTLTQYRDLSSRFALLCRVSVSCDVPALPLRHNNRHLWPVGTFDTIAWDTEVDCALRHGASVKIRSAWVYARAPILQEWARWVLERLSGDMLLCPPVVATHFKHCGRALIGRLALRTPSWEVFGANPEGITGLTHVIFPGEQRQSRMLHVGQDTLIETSREEGKDSLPMVTGYIMAECRARLFDAMMTAGTGNLAHVDTDSLLVNASGLARLRDALGAGFDRYWQVKGTYAALEVLGPRCYWRDRQRVMSGVPLRAEQQPDGTFKGERWSALASDLEAYAGSVVTVSRGTWQARKSDPRRTDAPGAAGRTAAIDAATLP